MNLLIVGSAGQVGSELIRACPKDWQVHAVDRRQMDMTDPAAIASVVSSVKPSIIVNATGYTAVDRAEVEPDLAMKVNRDGVSILAQEAKRQGSTLIHYSTDYVFDGLKPEPYQPDDASNPQSAYARSKSEGELAVRASGVRHVILRTQWVYGLHGRNFVLAIVKQAMKRPELRIVNDQIGAPTWSRSIARATLDIIKAGTENRDGTYHLVCGGSTTWFDFAKTVFDELNRRVPGSPRPHITPVSTAEYGAPAKRPAHAVLDCRKTEATFGVQMPHWRVALLEMMSDVPALRALLAPASAEARPT